MNKQLKTRLGIGICDRGFYNKIFNINVHSGILASFLLIVIEAIIIVSSTTSNTPSAMPAHYILLFCAVFLFASSLHVWQTKKGHLLFAIALGLLVCMTSMYLYFGCFHGVHQDVMLCIFIITILVLSCLFVAKPIHTFVYLVCALTIYLVAQANYGALEVSFVVRCLLCWIAICAVSFNRFHEAWLVYKHEQELFTISNRDELTRVNNRRALLEEIEMFFEKEIFVVIVDVDDFKCFNDTYGHSIGDEVLVTVAQALSIAFHGGRIYRYGGDEFLAMGTIEEHDVVHSAIVSFRGMLDDMSKKNIPKPIGTSVGYSVGRASSKKEMRELFKAADEFLYAAKADGKNCTRGDVVQITAP